MASSKTEKYKVKNEILYDADTMSNKEDHDYSESLIMLMDCLRRNADKRSCFRSFTDRLKPSPNAESCFKDLENCFFPQGAAFPLCVTQFKLCLSEKMR